MVVQWYYCIRGNFQGSYISQDFHGIIFADHRIEYIVSLNHSFFLRIKISRSASLQQNPRNLRPSKITAYTIYYYVWICLEANTSMMERLDHMMVREH